MLAKIGDWLDERFSWREVWEAIFERKVPHVNWFYTLGSATLFVAINQAITGILLTLYYVPTPDHAYDSVVYITTQVPAGWFIRGLHHWGASAMVVLTVLHMLRVLLHRAYKYPRELTWFTGVGSRSAAATPVFGLWIRLIVGGGEELSAVTLARFFGVHVWFLPAALIAILVPHLYLVIRIGISAARSE